MDKSKNLVTKGRFGERLGKSRMTIDRYRKRGLIPEPDIYILGRPHWREATVEAVEEKLLREDGPRHVDPPSRR